MAKVTTPEMVNARNSMMNHFKYFLNFLDNVFMRQKNSTKVKFMFEIFHQNKVDDCIERALDLTFLNFLEVKCLLILKPGNLS
jgi:hypothetical protein